MTTTKHHAFASGFAAALLFAIAVWSIGAVPAVTFTSPLTPTLFPLVALPLGAACAVAGIGLCAKRHWALGLGSATSATMMMLFAWDAVHEAGFFKLYPIVGLVLSAVAALTFALGGAEAPRISPLQHRHA